MDKEISGNEDFSVIFYGKGIFSSSGAKPLKQDVETVEFS